VAHPLADPAHRTMLAYGERASECTGPAAPAATFTGVAAVGGRAKGSPMQSGTFRSSRRGALVTMVAAAAVALATLGGLSPAHASSPPASDAPAPSAPAAPAPESAPALPTSGDAAGAWEQVVPGGDCQCADGAEFSFFVHHADPAKVVLYFEGGGACWDATTCAFTDDASTTYDWNIGDDEDPANRGGIFELDNPANPFAGWSMIFVPYCTGDVHIGDNTMEYSPELTVQHKGRVNGDAAVSYLAENFPDATQIVVAGASAGSIATPLYGGLVADHFPGASITVFGDGSGGYPDVAAVNALIGNAWGTMNDLPDWPEAAGATPETWSIPGLWVVAGTHAPQVVMSRFDYAFDQTQQFFAALAGVPAEDLMAFMDDNEARIEAAGVNQHSFTAPGDRHTLIEGDAFYTMEVGGTTLVDWLRSLVAGDDVADVHCTECEPPVPATTAG